MKRFHIKRLLLEEGARDYRITSRIAERLEGIPCERVGRVVPREEGITSQGLDKETIRLVRFPGALFKPCPGTRNYLCCGYQILHIGTNCPMDCSYCILQAYFNQPSIRIHVNLEEELEEIGRLIDRHPDKIFRVGTGEFTDSLVLEPIIGWGKLLFPFFSKRKNTLLELKTKDDRKKLLALIKTYFDNGGKHIQFNTVDRATLLDAQEHPERHRSLIVRVAGYSAFFAELSRGMQDEIIARSEHSL